MESRVKLFGHPVHPVLIVFPLGLLSVSVIFDVIGWVTGNGFWSTMAFYLIAAGIIGGALAAIFGWIDWSAIPQDTRAQYIGLMHGSINTLVLLLFIGSWVIRRYNPAQPSTFALVLSGGALALALLGGWLGGELVSRLGVSVEDGAHLNAPNSLSGRPASDVEPGMPAHPPQSRPVS